MSLGLIIRNAIDEHTQDDTIDLHAVAQELGCRFGADSHDTFIKGQLLPAPGDSEHMAVIHLNAASSPEQNKTVTALLLAKFLIGLGNGELKPVKIDTFALSELRLNRLSPQVILATRLTIPEHMIEKIDDLRFNSSGYAYDNKLLTSLVDSAFKISNPDGLMGMIRGLNIGVMNSNINSMSDVKRYAVIRR